jgi:hypothetical protein
MVDGPYHEETPKGRVESVHGGEVTSPLDPDNKVGADERISPNPWLEQLWARQQELEDARLQLEEEHTELEREIARHRDDRPMRKWARGVHRRIVEDDDGLLYFARAS